MGANSSGAGFRVFQPFGTREPGDQLRRVPWADQQDGRGLSEQTVEHDVLPGLPSTPGNEAATTGQDHGFELETGVGNEAAGVWKKGDGAMESRIAADVLGVS